MTTINIPHIAVGLGTTAMSASSISNIVQGNIAKGVVQAAMSVGITAMSGFTFGQSALLSGYMGIPSACFSQGFNKLAVAMKDRNIQEAVKGAGYLAAGAAISYFWKIPMLGTGALISAGALSSVGGYLWNKVANSPCARQVMGGMPDDFQDHPHQT